MNLYENFKGGFGDWITMASDTDLKDYILRVWFDPDTPDGDLCDLYFKIIGYTVLPNDILLHLVDVMDDTPTEEWANQHGVIFQLLSNLCGRHGFEILVEDQQTDEDDPED